MKYVIDITQRQIEEIKSLIDSEKYTDVSQFIFTAVENQLTMERSEAPQDILKETSPDHIKESTNSISFLVNPATLQEYNPSRHTERRNWGEKKLLSRLAIPKCEVLPPPKDEELSFVFQDAGPKNNWQWGQHNRVFPLKVGVRYLQHLLDGHPTIGLSALRSDSLKIVTALHSWLVYIEENKDIDREKRISTGLPGAASKDYKSQDRYRNQSLAILRHRDGKLDGGLVHHKFANIMIEGEKPVIGLTDAGLKFAELENPVLDSENLSASLSDEEIAFYIKNMRDNMPGEFRGAIWMLSVINQGLSREDINEALKDEYGPKWTREGKKPSSGVIETQRAGMTARLTELHLVHKDRDTANYKRINYFLTEHGKRLLEESR